MNVILVITSALIGLTSEAEVIIIGAGMSGLGAARKLVNTGGYAVTVLEARGRVGGRTWTDKDAVPGAIGQFKRNFISLEISLISCLDYSKNKLSNCWLRDIGDSIL